MAVLLDIIERLEIALSAQLLILAVPLVLAVGVLHRFHSSVTFPKRQRAASAAMLMMMRMVIDQPSD
jgi:hypothetical protein